MSHRTILWRRSIDRVEVTFLGTSSGTPTKDRNVTAVALRNGRSWDLFDCGEATQHQLLHVNLSLPRLRRIFISHLHGDHCYGLFGLLGSRAMSGGRTPLDIFGPLGLEKMVRTVLDLSSSHVDYPLRFHELDERGGRVVHEDTTIDAVPLDHRVTSFAWWIQEPDRPGEFDAERAVELGVQPGPDFARLHQGHAVVSTDGRSISPEDVVGPERRGRSMVIAGDNRDPQRLLSHTGGLDLLVHEATYTEDVVASIGEDYGHSTAHRVGVAAADAGVSNVVLTHFSPRYGSSSRASRSVQELYDEAAASYRGGLFLAEDFARYELHVDGSFTCESSPTG